MQTYHKIWMHFVWSTKKRERIIIKELTQKLIFHFKEYGEENSIYVDTVNGEMEHIHLLTGLKPTQAPSDIANLIKGESSHWINSNNFIRGKFSWQRGFSVFSVSESQVDKVRRYVRNQEEHHRKKSYREELNDLLKHHGVTP
ncbi:MAG: IS200/IS605 family transposase [Candidatus Marinimicrobia bacterium]|nr:IS200/IS605 family transposase [Candidatus Neomarinimicrobiota bacterium]